MFGKSPWLDSVMGITDYGHRGVPNVFLDAPLQSKGVVERRALQEPDRTTSWSKEYMAALDIGAQRAAAKKIQKLLLDETPIIFPYFYYFLTGDEEERGQRRGVRPWATYDITKAGFTGVLSGGVRPWPGSSPSGWLSG